MSLHLQNATLLEITCHDSIISLLTEAMKLRASGEVPEPDFFGEYGKK